MTKKFPAAFSCVQATRFDTTEHFSSHHDLAEEYPVAMVFNGSTNAVMMATPCDIEDFAHGFAMTEGFITCKSQIEDFEIIQHDAGIEARFWLNEDCSDALETRKRTLSGPIGCGLCGIDSLKQATRTVPSVADVRLNIPVKDAISATNTLRRFQPLHDRTHAMHAAGFIVPQKGIIIAREDVGRHNALDKVIGALTRQNIDPTAGAFVMTSRISVELVQKIAISGSSTLISVSAPTAHALRLAKQSGLSIAAFARGKSITIFNRPDRFSQI